jgi:hypothetical protein
MARRLTSILVASALGAAVLAPGASADPSNARSGLTFPATCGTTQVTFVVNGNGEFTPAHVSGSTAEFIPQSFDIAFEYTPAGGTTQSGTDKSSKAHAHGDLVTCSFDTTQVSPNGDSFRLSGTVTGFFTPAGKSG